jgi:hypothetical protein
MLNSIFEAVGKSGAFKPYGETLITLNNNIRTCED